MQPEKNSRLDIGDLKAQLLKKVGQESFKRYFHCLNRFINQKLSKSEFDKSCYRMLGRENLALHNQIIKAILRNACSSETPPPKSQEVGPTGKAGPVVGRCSPVLEDRHEPGLGQGQSSVAPIWSNGIVPLSPRKGRSSIRERKLKDSRSFLAGGKSLENGDLPPSDYQRPLHQLQRCSEQPKNDQCDAAYVKDREQLEHADELKLSKSPLIAPLAIPYCSASSGGTRKVLPGTHVGDYVSFFDLVGLSDSETLRRRMEQIAVVHGLEVTLESANMLNNMVDVYLKRLISSCLGLVGSRSINGLEVTLESANMLNNCTVQKQQIHGKPINGLRPDNHFHMQTIGGDVEAQRVHKSVSLLDFKVAVELNPQLVGESWSLLLEKISMKGLEEWDK